MIPLVYIIFVVCGHVYTAELDYVLTVGRCKDITKPLKQVNKEWIKHDIKSNPSWGVTHVAFNPNPEGGHNLNAMSFGVNNEDSQGDPSVEFIWRKIDIKGTVTHKETIQQRHGPKEMITKTAQGNMMRYYVLKNDGGNIMYLYKCTDDTSVLQDNFDARYILAKNSALTSDLKAKIADWETDFLENNVFTNKLYPID